jgi:mRNA interferase MazF
VVALRFDVYLVELSPALGSEMQKTRPCLVISPDQLNRWLTTVIVAPLTTRRRAYPSRVDCQFQGRDGQVALDQLRAVDRTRLIRRLGRIDPTTQAVVLATLGAIFAE